MSGPNGLNGSQLFLLQEQSAPASRMIVTIFFFISVSNYACHLWRIPCRKGLKTLNKMAEKYPFYDFVASICYIWLEYMEYLYS